MIHCSKILNSYFYAELAQYISTSSWWPAKYYYLPAIWFFASVGAIWFSVAVTYSDLVAFLSRAWLHISSDVTYCGCVLFWEQQRHIIITFAEKLKVHSVRQWIFTYVRSENVAATDDTFPLCKDILIVALCGCIDRLCGLTVRVRSYRSKGPGLILSATIFSEK
jgi:hypothetical protein